jgi:hypothetical protein
MSKPNADDLLETIWPICPHCGFEKRDAWELELDEYFTDGWECGSCLRAMLIKRNVYVTYTTAEAKREEV